MDVVETLRRRVALLGYLQQANDPATLVTADLAEQFGLSHAQVYYAYHVLHLPVRKRGRKPGKPRPKAAPQPRKVRTDFHSSPLYGIVASDPSRTDTEIAAENGVSRERVRQVRASLGLPPSAKPACANGHLYAEVGYRTLPSGKRACAGCRPLPHSPKTVTFTCEDCQQQITMTGKQRTTWLHNRQDHPDLPTTCAPCGRERSGRRHTPHRLPRAVP